MFSGEARIRWHGIAKGRGLDIRKARRMVQDRSECWGVVRGNAWGIAWEMNP